jgi:uracil-DNA glycosylase
VPADEPGRDCPRCPRLVAFRNDNRAAEPAWHNAPVPSFGDDGARLLVVGLAPGLKGANRTGRPFTGDFAGDLLYATLIATGFARGAYDKRPDDALRLIDCAITNAVRCVPPQNKPLPIEIATCRPYLSARLVEMPRLAAIVALGRIAHESVLRALGVKLAAAPFGHGAQHALARSDSAAITLFDSYHCSRYNTSTRVLTEAMFNDVFVAVRAHIDAA